jgi:hypothetical protein
MALLDCFSSYLQIWQHKEDEEKMSFITSFGTYCHLRMLEGLNNAGPMFCRMTKSILKDQMHRNVISYVDDIVVASKKKSTHIDDLVETFTNMCGAKLNFNKKMRIRHSEGQTAGMFSTCKGDRSQPR